MFLCYSLDVNLQLDNNHVIFLQFSQVPYIFVTIQNVNLNYKNALRIVCRVEMGSRINNVLI